MADFVSYPDPALSRKAEARPIDAAMLAAGEALLDAGRQASAFGLAAAHLGLCEPVVLVSLSGKGASRDYCVMFNPEVVAVGDVVESDVEGSVSMPGIEVPVERPQWCEVAHDDRDGMRRQMRLTDFAARVALHEIDQMNGVFFLSRVSRLKRDAAIRRFRKMAAR